jgi:hypothetical protein
MFRLYDHLEAEIYLLRIYSTDNGSVVFRIYLTLWITIVIGLIVGCFVDVVAVVY